ncbi:MAG TPA: TIGR03557 family F420-dependent LLM class oxidoreductase [Gaiellaceae bacterium]|nr:TIGR03557 family F420-dependent LLM class oxidoreductase [Gaiellaceae bacterium]
MTEFGYWLSSEEHPPLELVRNAARAEELGFAFAMISDHFHPWIAAQGQSPFVWGVLGGIAAATERIEVATGVTCPLIRTHPAIVAHAAATAGAMLPGRFTLGLGTGENLNEHVLGDRWPAPDERIELLEEAIEVIRLLWQGEEQTHRGRHYVVDHAQLYTLPVEPIPIAVAAARPNAAELAGRAGDALVSTDPNEETVKQYREGGGDGPCYGQVRICWAESEDEAKETVFRLWRHSGLGGTINQELPRPSDFNAVAESVTVEMAVDGVPCGPDAAPVLEQIRSWERAGFDRIAIHQVGPDQAGFFRFWEQELQPRLA